MLSSKVEARKSTIHGIGLFAKCDISKGTILWEDDDSVIKFRYNDVENLNPKLRDFIIKYVGSGDKNNIHLDTDQGIHMNHSCQPNNGIASDGLTEIALRDIKNDEEITINYLDFPINKELDFKCNCARHKFKELVVQPQ